MTEIEIRETEDGRFEVVEAGCPHWLRHDTRAEAEAQARLMAAPLDLDAIEARAQAATPGPWSNMLTDYEGKPLDVYIVYDSDEQPVCECRWIPRLSPERYEDWRPNAAFIAAAREDVPALCAEVRRLRLLWASRGTTAVLSTRLEAENAALKEDLEEAQSYAVDNPAYRRHHPEVPR